MKKTFPEIPEWTFDITEVSAGVYQIIGRSKAGLSTSLQGTETELEDLIQQAKRNALELDETTKRKRNDQ